MPFEFKGLKFPVRLALAITVNTNHRHKRACVCVGGGVLNFENIFFSHGQLYVACLRVEKHSDLFVSRHRTKNKTCYTFKSTWINWIETKAISFFEWQSNACRVLASSYKSAIDLLHNFFLHRNRFIYFL